MSLEKVREHLERFGLEDRIKTFDVSSATVELAAEALGVEGARIAKSISVYDADGGCIIVVAAGDYKLDNSRFKAFFGFKPRMLTPEDALRMTSHAVGGVCPFALPERVRVYLDNSLLRFDKIYPAAGTSQSAVELTPEELKLASGAISFGDICKPKE